MSKNELNFTIKEQIQIYNAVVTASEIVGEIENMLSNSAKEKTPPITETVNIKVETLYNICSTLQAAYTELLEKSLISCGHPKRTTDKLH